MSVTKSYISSILKAREGSLKLRIQLMTPLSVCEDEPMRNLEAAAACRRGHSYWLEAGREKEGKIENVKDRGRGRKEERKRERVERRQKELKRDRKENKDGEKMIERNEK